MSEVAVFGKKPLRRE